MVWVLDCLILKSAIFTIELINKLTKYYGRKNI